MVAMEFEQVAAEDVVKRLRRVEGQIGGVIRMLEEHRSCTDVLTQLAAASHALDRTGFKLFSAGMQQCLSAPTAADGDPMSVEQMEKLFIRLA